MINTDDVLIDTFLPGSDKGDPGNCFVVDGKLYMMWWRGINWVIEETSVDAEGSLVCTTYASGTDPDSEIIGGFKDYTSKKAHYEVHAQGHAYYLYKKGEEITEIYNPTALAEDPRYFGEKISAHLSTIYDYDHTDNEIYFIGKDKNQTDTVIVKFDPATGESVIYQSTSDYYTSGPEHIHQKTMVALGGGEVLFVGKRFSDGLQALLIADQSGVKEIAVMDKGYDDDIICFERFEFNVD